MDKQVRNARLPHDRFFKVGGEEVPPQWETGRQIEDLDECVVAAKELSQGKSCACRSTEARDRGAQLLTPQFGRALTEYVIEGLTHVETEGGLAPDGMSVFDGRPLVNFDVEEARRIRRASRVPMALNSIYKDGRLSSEMALAAERNGANTRSPRETCRCLAKSRSTI